MLQYLPSDWHVVRFATYPAQAHNAKHASVVREDRLPSAAGAPYDVYVPRATQAAAQMEGAYEGTTAVFYQRRTANETLEILMNERCYNSPDAMMTVSVMDAEAMYPGMLPCPKAADGTADACCPRTADSPGPCTRYSGPRPLRSFVIDAQTIINIGELHSEESRLNGP